jgi:riboflavin kinase/FMN adenylyltransferase
MLIIRNNFKEVKKYNYSIAVGNFDGIHKGHKYLLNELIKFKKTKDDKIAVLSFTPHPIKLIAPDIWKKNLVKFRTKYERLSLLGIDALFLITFSENFRKVKANEFIEKFLIKKINVKNIVVGEDFKFGNKRKGDVNLLLKYKKKKLF